MLAIVFGRPPKFVLVNSPICWIFFRILVHFRQFLGFLHFFLVNIARLTAPRSMAPSMRASWDENHSEVRCFDVPVAGKVRIRRGDILGTQLQVFFEGMGLDGITKIS